MSWVSCLWLLTSWRCCYFDARATTCFLTRHPERLNFWLIKIYTKVSQIEVTVRISNLKASIRYTLWLWENDIDPTTYLHTLVQLTPAKKSLVQAVLHCQYTKVRQSMYSSQNFENKHSYQLPWRRLAEGSYRQGKRGDMFHSRMNESHKASKCWLEGKTISNVHCSETESRHARILSLVIPDFQLKEQVLQ